MSGDVPDCSNLSWGNRSREGTITGEKVSQLYRFVVGYQDPTDLYHLGARYLDTNLGRFTQPDPSGLETDPYLYASGDPTNIIDPSGLFSFGNFMGDSGARWWQLDQASSPSARPLRASPSRGTTIGRWESRMSSSGTPSSER
ncbi:RHS repeat-associated core domain-containing protein [Streptomyces sp. NPDC020747]|uniref:RHS repeat-associated core domain-containing protein n=1 Tax=Streptomyces sp. NPDC020747 TaxID=3365086 RepID=UPI0037BBE0EB